MPRMTSGKINVNKDKFDEVCSHLEQIRKELNLKKRKTLNCYTEIVTRYNQIDTQTDEIKQYTTEHPSAKNKLRNLECKIAVLMTTHNLRFGIIQQGYEDVEKENDTKPLEGQAEEHKKTNKQQRKSPEIKQKDTADTESLQKQQFTKEMKLREQMIIPYTNLLKQLEIKRDEFHTRYPDYSCDDVSKAYGAACQLVNILNGYAVSYKTQAIDLTQFKENSSRVIQSRRNGILGEHRGVKELLTNLLLAIGTLGIGYAFAALFTRSFTPIKCNTDTVDLLNETNKKLNELAVVHTISI